MARGDPGGLLPAKARALLSYAASARAPSALPMVALQRTSQSEIDAMVAEAFSTVEAELGRALADGDLEYADDAAGDAPRFDYDTRLLLPAMLAHARIHLLAGNGPVAARLPGRSPDETLLERGRETTTAVVRALLDGDVRDAINDEEFEDFETNCRPKRRVAELAQGCLSESVEAFFDRPDVPEAVEERYRHAVSVSEAHQDADEGFRGLLAALEAAGPDERESVADDIRDRYAFAEPRDPPALFESELDLPYFATQYERVGILYEDMVRMYEAALDRSFGDGFARAIVLMVVGAQIGLDDVDDYPDDRGEQLTPVTAELALADDRRTGVESVREVLDAYLDRAENAAPDHLTGIAVEYVRQQSYDRLEGLAP